MADSAELHSVVCPTPTFEVLCTCCLLFSLRAVLITARILTSTSKVSPSSRSVSAIISPNLLALSGSRCCFRDLSASWLAFTAFSRSLSAGSVIFLRFHGVLCFGLAIKVSDSWKLCVGSIFSSETAVRFAAAISEKVSACESKKASYKKLRSNAASMTCLNPRH